MPPSLVNATDCGALRVVTDEQAVIAVSRGVRLTSAGEAAGRAWLSEHREHSAVLLLQAAENASSKLSCTLAIEAWRELPARLAALAIAPPTLAAVVARPVESVTSALNATGVEGNHSLWRFLVALTKHDSQISALPTTAGQSWLTVESGPENSGDVRLPGLLSSPPAADLAWLFQELSLLRIADLGGHVTSPVDATAVLAGLWLLHGDGDHSHRISQTIEDQGRHRSGNFWHGIMHRQEPDYDNAKYWFRRVSSHPIFPELARRADELLAAESSAEIQAWRKKLGVPNRWDAAAFVDLCEAAADDGSTPLADVARRLQFLEMHRLLRATFAEACQPIES